MKTLSKKDMCEMTDSQLARLVRNASEIIDTRRVASRKRTIESKLIFLTASAGGVFFQDPAAYNHLSHEDMKRYKAFYYIDRGNVRFIYYKTARGHLYEHSSYHRRYKRVQL